MNRKTTKVDVKVGSITTHRVEIDLAAVASDMTTGVSLDDRVELVFFLPDMRPKTIVLTYPQMTAFIAAQGSRY